MSTHDNHADRPADVPAAPVLAEEAVAAYEHKLRADRSEAAMRDAEHKLARILQMVDTWENTLPEVINTGAAADAIRTVIRPGGSPRT